MFENIGKKDRLSTKKGEKLISLLLVPVKENTKDLDPFSNTKRFRFKRNLYYEIKTELL